MQMPVDSGDSRVSKSCSAVGRWRRRIARADVHKRGISRLYGGCRTFGRTIETRATRGQDRGRRKLCTAFRVAARRYPHVTGDMTAFEVPGMISADFPKT